VKWLGIILSFPLFYFLIYHIPRDQAPLLLAVFLGWCVLIIPVFQKAKPSRLTLPLILLLGLAIRLVALPATPPWTDDYFRFLWDGELLTNGINPYSILPSEVSTEMHIKLSQLNSPEYYTIYPPFAQGLFALSVFSAEGDSTLALIILRVAFILADIFNILLIYKILKRFNYNPWLSLLYAFHPLILMELNGNLHLEVFMITGLLCFIYGMIKGNRALWIIGLAFAIHIKLIPVIIIPFLLFRNPRDIVAVSLALALAFLPFVPFWMNGGFMHWLESLRLYSSHLEFNGSIYYLLRWLGYQLKGYNLIFVLGPLLSLLSLGLIAWIGYRTSNQSEKLKDTLIPYLALAWLIFYLFSTTVHPWYITPFIVFSLFTKLRFTLVAPVTMVFSYVSYSLIPFSEPVWLSCIVYVPILAALYADRQKIKSVLQLNK
jgi:hypothetical protein